METLNSEKLVKINVRYSRNGVNLSQGSLDKFLTSYLDYYSDKDFSKTLLMNNDCMRE